LPSRRRGTASAGGPRHLFVDSGPWIALAYADDAKHAEANGLFRAALARRIRLLTTSLVVAECHHWLLFRTGIRPARAFLSHLDSSAALTIEFPTAEHHRAGEAWLTRLADQRITYTDAVSFAVMRALGCSTAMSFDHDFVVAGFRLWQPD
jgi:uncharacterized protein